LTLPRRILGQLGFLFKIAHRLNDLVQSTKSSKGAYVISLDGLMNQQE